MAKDPAFLFYSQDWITGTQVLTFEDRGKYIHILALMHQQGRMDEETIRFLVGSVSVKLKSKFLIDDNGLWYNSKLESETEKRNDYVKSRHENGKKGGRPKKEKKPYGKPKGNHMGNENEDENDNVIKDKNESKGENKKVVLPWDSATFLLSWKHWKEYKQTEHKFNYKSGISEQAALKELTELSEGFEENAIKIINHSISKGWKGFFKLKEEDYAKRVIKTTKEHQSDIDEAASRYFRD